MEQDEDEVDLSPATFLARSLDEQLRLIPKLLSYIPDAFKAKKFDTLRMVLAILSSPDPKEAIVELNESIEMIDLAMKSAVNGSYPSSPSSSFFFCSLSIGC